jgi:hypothetical protein
MKTYRVSRLHLWSMSAAKVLLTGLAAAGYVSAVTHPTPLAYRLLLLAAMVFLGWLLYVRYPKMPTEIEVDKEGWVLFRGPRGETRVRVADIRAVGHDLGGGTVRIRHAGGRLYLFNRVPGFYDFLSTIKSLNPAIVVRGF